MVLRFKSELFGIFFIEKYYDFRILYNLFIFLMNILVWDFYFVSFRLFI